MRIPLLGPLPIDIGGDIIYPSEDACFACTPPYQHPRKWMPDANARRTQRTLVLCFDGTCDSFDQDNSNVVQPLSALKKDDPAKQLVYYQAGIGTYTGNDVLGTSVIQSASRLFDQMVAWNLPVHIKGGYLFLMQNYRLGDHICIFGFSRGAYTALALAGMLQKVGLLPQCNIEQLPFAYAMYEREDREGLDLSVQFKRTFSVDVQIQFLGVWDTVQSVGLIPKHLPFSGYNNAVVNFRHALALDEHRVKFMPFFYTGRKPKHRHTDTHAFELTDAAGGDISDVIGGLRGSAGVSDFEVHINTMTGPDTNVEEVFFAGAHCDVGGGSVQNGTRHSLARIPLRWMIRECFKVQSGIIFDAHMLRHEIGLGIDSTSQAPTLAPPHLYPLTEPNDVELQGVTCLHILFTIFSGLAFPLLWLWSKIESLHFRKPPVVLDFPNRRRFEYKGEAEETVRDALSRIYDQLDLHWYWKVMEWIPWVVKKQSAEVADDFWAYKFVWNRKKGRRVYHSTKHHRIKVHKSVRIRMSAENVGGDSDPYWPKIRCMVNGSVRRPTRKEWLADDPDFLEWVD